MRNTNQFALATDVACMGGAGIAQICNAVALDERHEHVIIHAGNNEIMNTITAKEFVYTVEKSAEKLTALAKDTEVTLVLPLVPPVGAFETAKSMYLEEKMKAVSAIQTLKLKSVEYDEQGNHPTEKGTAEIINQMHEHFSNEIILPEAENETTTPRKYSNVRAIYKTGCRGCATEEYTSYLCTECKKRAENVDATDLDTLIDKIQNEMFPENPQTVLSGHDLNMEIDINKKRGRPQTTHENGRKHRRKFQ